MPKYHVEHYPENGDWYFTNGDGFRGNRSKPKKVICEDYYFWEFNVEQENLVEAVRYAEQKIKDFLKAND